MSGEGTLWVLWVWMVTNKGIGFFYAGALGGGLRELGVEAAGARVGRALWTGSFPAPSSLA